MRSISNEIYELNKNINRKSNRATVSRKDACSIALFIFMILIAYFVPNKHIKFMVASLFAFYIIYRAKISYFSAFTFILWFSFLQEYIAAINKAISSGMLRSGHIPIYYDELYICTVLFLLCELMFFSFTSILYRERKMYLLKIEMSKAKAYFIGVCSLLLVILSYPSLPTLSAKISRNEGVIESARYVQIALLLLSITYDSLHKYKCLIFLWITTIIWILFHGERVIVMGLFIYMGIKYLNQNSKNNSNLFKTILKGRGIFVLTAAILIVMLGVYIQYSRMGITREYTIMDIIAQGTAGDVVYVFNCSIDLWKNNNLLCGYSLLRYITDLLPAGTNMALSPAVLITDYYYTVGGGLFFVEPIMNFGIYGVIPYTIVIFSILNFILKKPCIFTLILWISIVFTIFRATWYCGFFAWKFAIYLTPFLYFYIKKIRLHRKKRFL